MIAVAKIRHSIIANVIEHRSRMDTSFEVKFITNIITPKVVTNTSLVIK